MTIFCPPSVGDFGAENPGVVLVTILPLCRKKAGLDSYENKTLSFSWVDFAVVVVLGTGIDIVAVRHTDPYEAHERDKYAASAVVLR